MTLRDFLTQLLAMPLITMNELSVLLELGYDDFSREDILANEERCPINTYSPSALTRTLQKLSAKNPAIISTSIGSNGQIIYRLIDRCNSYAGYEPILLSICRSRVLTVNTIRVAMQLIVNKNRPTSARYLANQLKLTPDYLAATVLPRMIVIGLVIPKIPENPYDEDACLLLEQERQIKGMNVIHLDLDWNGTSKTVLL